MRRGQEKRASARGRQLDRNSGDSGGKEVSTLLVGVLVSVCVAVVLALVTTTTVLLGFIGALIGTAIALQYELLRRFEARNAIEDKRSVLLAAVEGHPWLLDQLRDIAVHAGGVLRRRDSAPLFVELLRNEIARTRNMVYDLDRGRLRVPSGNVTPMSEQIDLVRRTVHATTIPEADADWWLSASGADYLKRNKAAIQDRGVAIERIVLWERVDEKLAELVQNQLDAKVSLYFVERATVAADLRISIAIYDRSVVHDVIFNHDGLDIFYDYSLDEATCEEACDKFERLKVVASAAPPPALLPYLAAANLRVVDEAGGSTPVPADDRGTQTVRERHGSQAPPGEPGANINAVDT